MYILKILRCLWLARCILICCSSVSLWLVVCGVFNSVKIMSFYMYVIIVRISIIVIVFRNRHLINATKMPICILVMLYILVTLSINIEIM